MDFQLNEDQKLFRDSIREFLEKEILPIEKEKEPLGKPLTHDEVVNVVKKFRKVGISSDIDDIKWIASDLTLFGILSEEMGRVAPGTCTPLIYSIAIPALIQFLPDGMEIKERLLPKIKRSEILATYSLTEPNAGSDNKAMTTTAVLDGDEYVINGRKTWATVGPISDLCLLVAKNEKGEQEMFLIDRERSPYESSELGHMGIRTCSTGELFFDDCRVPKENNLTNIMTKMLSSDKTKISSRMLNLFSTITPVSLVLAVLRTGMAMLSTGISQACLEASVNYAKERVQFGRPIGKFQLIQEMIYKIATITETSRLLGYKALNLLSRGDTEFRKASSMAKAYACKEVVKAASYAIEIHGGIGLSDELPVEKYFRDARMMSIPDGTTNINKLIVGREILGPGFSAYV
ncbi:MAG: acyl-CoA dehydrogenase family protein [Deferribacterota bacterium]|nr:acyl-CoA dehydrogenase family protein [Deferribacterota bacterium]